MASDMMIVVAQASGRKPGDERWTELTIYQRQDPRALDPFVAEIVGAVFGSDPAPVELLLLELLLPRVGGGAYL